MKTPIRFKVADLDLFPQPIDDTRYEVIDGELFVSHQPHAAHQNLADEFAFAFRAWNRQTGRGYALSAPGIIFSTEEAAAPDVVWFRRERKNIVAADGKLHDAPDIVVEVESPGAQNERRDREAKLGLYSRYGVREYWLASYVAETIRVYRHQDGELRLMQTLAVGDALTSPLLPDFRLPLDTLFPSPFGQ
jgi:Uma2 family endonuclease